MFKEFHSLLKLIIHFTARIAVNHATPVFNQNTNASKVMSVLSN